ncbi:hypothetical protein NL676_023686 [Syzygium grande]|nr:hypothetical protein NL676_023686 [Syzygium grande]
MYCEICIERVPSTSRFKTTARCKHSFCSRCLSSYVALRIGDGVADVRCPGLTRCYCPNSNCRELIVDECGQSGDVKRFKCPSCRQRGCFRCASAWAKGHRCRSTHDKDLILLERLADMKKWMRCPNCRMYVERNGDAEGGFAMIVLDTLQLRVAAAPTVFPAPATCLAVVVCQVIDIIICCCFR